MKRLALKESKVHCEGCGRLVRASRIVVVPRSNGAQPFTEMCPRCADSFVPARPQGERQEVAAC